MLRISSIVWGVENLARSIDFWSTVLHYKLLRQPETDEAILVPYEAGAGPQFILRVVSSPRARRHHIDLHTTNQGAEVARLLRCGAKHVTWRYEFDADYVVLTDPDGNRFCVVQHQ